MTDNVNHPSHYAEGWSNGAELIHITENLSFNRGNAVKYIARAGKKDAAKELEDLLKAEFYLKREIQRLEEVDLDAPKQPRVWNNWDDIPAGVWINSSDEEDGDCPWMGDPGEGPFGRGPWREVLDV